MSDALYHLFHAFLPLEQPDTSVVCIASMAGHLIGASPAASYPGLDGVLDEPLHDEPTFDIR